MNIPLINLTRERANAILSAWKLGVEAFPDHVIKMALYVTGDLSSLR
jgi:hypothetical protein